MTVHLCLKRKTANQGGAYDGLDVVSPGGIGGPNSRSAFPLCAKKRCNAEGLGKLGPLFALAFAVILTAAPVE